MNVKNFIPIIDISDLWKKDEKEWNKIIEDIDKASRTLGFFYIVGHPIKEDKLDKMMEIAKSFFDLPVEKKLEVDMSKNRFHRGYGKKYLEQLDPMLPYDEKETLEWGVKLTTDNPLIENKLYGPNNFPSVFDQATIDLLESHYKDVTEVSKMLLRAMALALHLDKDYFTQYYDYPIAVMRMMHYTNLPSSSSENNYNNKVGGGQHTDYGCLTLLQQDEFGSHQVKIPEFNHSNEWIDVPYVKGSFIVNIGDMLGRWTNDIYKSRVHRVLKPPVGVDSYSLPLFGEPRHDTIISCIPSCCTESPPKHYEPISAADYFEYRLLKTYEFKQQR